MPYKFVKLKQNVNCSWQYFDILILIWLIFTNDLQIKKKNTRIGFLNAISHSMHFSKFELTVENCNFTSWLKYMSNIIEKVSHKFLIFRKRVKIVMILLWLYKSKLSAIPTAFFCKNVGNWLKWN